MKIGFAMCGSFCTFSRVLSALRLLAAEGHDIYPILSYAAASTDTRFGSAESLKNALGDITGRIPIETITEAEPIGPKKLFDLLIVAPATGNTLAKLAAGIADTPVTLAVKSHLRNNRPVLIAVSTNDALGTNAAQIGALLARRNIYAVPFGQDDSAEKPCSAVADFTKIPAAAAAAMRGEQLQPVLM